MANGKDKNNGSNLGFEADLFKTADKLRGNMEPSDYKHVALGLICLKYISDAFEARHASCSSCSTAKSSLNHCPEILDHYMVVTCACERVGPEALVRVTLSAPENPTSKEGICEQHRDFRSRRPAGTGPAGRRNRLAESGTDSGAF